MSIENIKYNLSTELEEAIVLAGHICKDNAHARVQAAHLMKALLHKNFYLRPWLIDQDVDVYYLEDWAEIRIESYIKGNINNIPIVDDSLNILWKESEEQKYKWQEDHIGIFNIFQHLLTPGIVFSHEQLKTLPIHYSIFDNQRIANKNGNQSINNSNNINTSSNLSIKYLQPLFHLLPNTDIFPYACREKEVQQIVEIISRKQKSNVILVGEPGVGKSTLLACLAQTLQQELVPEFMTTWKSYSLQINKLIAGTNYKAEIEDRFQKVMASLLEQENIILCIDDINLLLDTTQKNNGITSILKEASSKGNIAIVATASNDTYRKQIENDNNLNRNFEKLTVTAPTVTQAITMLEQIVPVYENFHQVGMEKESIKTIVLLAQRYLHERSLPDSAIDLLDRTMAVYKIMKSVTEKQWKIHHDLLQNSIEDNSSLDELYDNISKSYTATLWSRVESSEPYPYHLGIKEKQEYVDNLLHNIKLRIDGGFDQIADGDIYAIIAKITGMPLGKVQANEQARLLEMEAQLSKRVIGQDVAVKAVTDAILESRSGLIKEGQPIASFFFLGPTGTGKTELAKALAEFLFDDEKTIIRFDMSEFKEEHAAALLYGAPPGYVGYEEGGMLVNKIRQQPYAIVLFDEIEKAHPSVFDTFLQILDEGKLTDKLGNVGNFSNAVILFTSNIGAEFIIQSYQEGKVPTSDQLMEKMTSYFRPEFLARITEIVPFAPIAEQNVHKIFDIHIQPIKNLLAQQHIQFSMEEKARQWLAMQGFSPRYGVRPLKNIIRSGIRKPLSKLIVQGELQPHQKVTGKLITEHNQEKITWHISNQ